MKVVRVLIESAKLAVTSHLSLLYPVVAKFGKALDLGSRNLHVQVVSTGPDK